MSKESIKNKILSCTDEQLDLGFALIKYPELGILRKVKCFSLVFGIDFDDLLSILPKTSDDRILNKNAKLMLRGLLMERVNYGQKEKQK
jgi:hypothetical protein